MFMCTLILCFISVLVASPPTNLTAVQTGPTSIDVSWTPPTPLGDTTGYIIYYTNDDSGSVNVTIDNSSTVAHTLTDLQNGETYTISIIATSQHLPSETVDGNSVMLYPGIEYMNIFSFSIHTYTMWDRIKTLFIILVP